MTEQEMKILHERLKKEDPKLLSVMEKCFDADVLSGKEQAQRTWVGLTDEEYKNLHLQMGSMYFYQDYGRAIESKLKEKNTWKTESKPYSWRVSWKPITLKVHQRLLRCCAIWSSSLRNTSRRLNHLMSRLKIWSLTSEQTTQEVQTQRRSS